MILANDMTHGHFDLSSLTTINDIVTIDGRHYQAMSLLPTIPYLAARSVRGPVAVLALDRLGRRSASWPPGWPCPVARRYGPGGAATYWLAALGAFGTMLFTLAIEGNFYYLAHLESVLLVLPRPDRVARPAPAVGPRLAGRSGHAGPPDAAARGGAAGLAPAGRGAGTELRVAVGFALPHRRSAGRDRLPSTSSGSARRWRPATASPAIAPPLEALRAQGLFSIVHVPTNLALFVGGGFGIRDAFPWLVPSIAGPLDPADHAGAADRRSTRVSATGRTRCCGGRRS